MADASWAAGGEGQRGRGADGSEHLVRAAPHAGAGLEGGHPCSAGTTKASPGTTKVPSRAGNWRARHKTRN